MAPPKKNKRETVPEFDDIKDDEPSDMKLLADGTFAVIMPPTAIDKLRIRCEWCKKTMKYSYAKKHFIKTSNDACVYWEDYEKWLNEKASAETSNDEEDDGISLPFNKERERASDDESSNGDGEEEPAPKKLPAIKKKKSSSRPLPKRAASTEPASAQRSKKKQKAASSPRTPSRRSTYDNHSFVRLEDKYVFSILQWPEW
eukprot:CAMPEP_0172471444 /NCGR_PEP_ID=MMETSP1065-20121228/67818_1 /TAXON_ID=265537 /ORGANISM="Amphiprora paludosa, Strain CCMP125" /LENGTH=200 /DNA_ID=CAMNT_0013229539 /DNA_START=43 /DNA_END=642 /DNA_ORIENTATION=+